MNVVQHNTLLNARLSALHKKSDDEIYAKARAQFKGTDEEFVGLVKQYSALSPGEKGLFLKANGISVQDSTLSLAISSKMGEFLFNLTLSKKPQAILELGSSNGVSTLYFAEALRLLGGGKIVATELNEVKCEALRSNIQALALTPFVDLRQGDVFATTQDIHEKFDIVFIDIWASGYLDIFRQVEKLLNPGAIILADNMFTSADEVQPFKGYLDGNPNISNSTLNFESGVEFGVVR